MVDCHFLYLLLVAAGFCHYLLVLLAHVADGYPTGFAVVLFHRSGCDSLCLPVGLAVAPLDISSHLSTACAHVLPSFCAYRVVHLLVCSALVADVFSGCSVGRMALGFVLHTPEGLAPFAHCFVLRHLHFVCYVVGNSLFPLVLQAH